MLNETWESNYYVCFLFFFKNEKNKIIKEL